MVKVSRRKRRFRSQWPDRSRNPSPRVRTVKAPPPVRLHWTGEQLVGLSPQELRGLRRRRLITSRQQRRLMKIEHRRQAA